MNAPDPELLADLDADLLEPERAGRVRSAAQADPGARAVLAALAATRVELAAAADPPLPPGLAERWNAALAAEVAARPGHGPRPGEPDEPSEPQPRRHEPRQHRPAAPSATHAPRPHGRNGAPRSGPRRIPRGRLLLAGSGLALLLLAGLTAGLPRPSGLTGVQLAGAGLAAAGADDAGGLDDPARRAACLRAVAAPGVPPDAPLIGARRVTYEGRAGILLLLGTGRRGAFDVVVVDPGCGPAGGVLLGTSRTGR